MATPTSGRARHVGERLGGGQADAQAREGPGSGAHPASERASREPGGGEPGCGEHLVDLLEKVRAVTVPGLTPAHGQRLRPAERHDASCRVAVSMARSSPCCSDAPVMAPRHARRGRPASRGRPRDSDGRHLRRPRSSMARSVAIQGLDGDRQAVRVEGPVEAVGPLAERDAVVLALVEQPAGEGLGRAARR